MASSPYAAAIASIESGGRYGILGPVTKSGDRAYGKYQVMGTNIEPWTKEVLGISMTPQQFLQSPEAQDAVFNVKFGQSVAKYGNPQDAASVWFSGKPLAKAGNASDGYTTVPQYVAKFSKALGAPQQPMPLLSSNPATPTTQVSPFGAPASIPNQGTNVPNMGTQKPTAWPTPDPVEQLLFSQPPPISGPPNLRRAIAANTFNKIPTPANFQGFSFA